MKVVVVESLSRVQLLWPHGLQHIRLPCTFTVSWRFLILMSIESVICHSTISSSVVPFSSHGLFSSDTVESIHPLVLSLLYDPTLTSFHGSWKNHSLDHMDLCWQSFAGPLSLLFNMVSRKAVIVFLPRSKCHLVSRLQSLSTVILKQKLINTWLPHFDYLICCY